MEWEQERGEDLQVGSFTTNGSIINTPYPVVTQLSDPVDWREVQLREKAVELTCMATGMEEIGLEEFATIMEFFYTYLKTGKTNINTINN